MYNTIALEEPTQPVSLSFQVLLGFANAGATIALLPVLFVLIPAQVNQINPQNAATNLALVLSVGAASAMIGNPLAGALSDRTTSRFGRRRPWILVGMILTACGLAVLANSRSILLLMAGWAMVQFFGNMLYAAYGAVLPDRVPVNQRGTTQALVGFASPIGIILGDLFSGRVQDYRAGYYPIILVLVILTTVFLFYYHEPRLPKGVLPHFRLRSFLSSFWINPQKYPSFSLAWVAWFLVWMGFSMGTGGYLFLFIQNITEYTSLYPGHEVKEGIANLQIMQILWGVPLMMLMAVMSDRIRRRKVFVTAGALLVSLGMAMLGFFTRWNIVMIAGVTIGAGFWIYYSLGLAMISQVLPSASSHGKDLGVINIAATLPQTFMPTVGALVLNTIGVSSPLSYTVLFMTGAASALLGGILMQFIRGVR